MSKLLIVDAEDAFVEFARQVLGSQHQVDACNKASDIPGKIMSGNYDMLLMDLNMPGLNVGDLLALLRNLPTFFQTRVLLLSDGDEAELKKTAEQFECEPMKKTQDEKALLGLVRHSFASMPPGSRPPQKPE